MIKIDKLNLNSLNEKKQIESQLRKSCETNLINYEDNQNLTTSLYILDKNYPTNNDQIIQTDIIKN